MSLSGTILSGINRARQLVLTTMLNDATIQRMTDGVDESGAPTRGTFAPIATIKCGMQVATANASAEAIITGRITNNKDYLFRFPIGTDIREEDRIVVGTNTFEVLSVGRTHALSVQTVVFARTI